MKRSLVFILIFVVMLISSCQARPGEDIGGYRQITPDELHGMMENKDFLLVNVHIPFEGDLPGTDASVPYNEIEANLDRLPADKKAKIVLYCKSSGMSMAAADQLVGMGYKNVYELAGGFTAWEAAGFPLEKAP